MSEQGAGAFDPSAAARAIAARLDGPGPEILVVLGSGLGGVADAVDEALEIPFYDVPGYPSPAVEGHAGRYLLGGLEGRRVLVQAGRFHHYEGHPMSVVCGPVRVARRLGVDTVLLTNAAGSLDPAMGPGSLMLIADHINFMGASPLAGPVQEGEVRFPDMTAPWDPELRALARRAAAEEGVALHEGVYAAVAGPSYETAAEIRMLRGLGADAVGMSTVPEVITARALGMRCVGFSSITNFGTGIGEAPLSHDEVIAVGRESGVALERLVRRVLRDAP